MNELEQAREQIDRIDAEMAALFVRRMEICRKIAAYKKACGLPVRDTERERAMLRARCGFLNGAVLEPYYTEFLRSVVALSCRYQAQCMGAEGAET